MEPSIYGLPESCSVEAVGLFGDLWVLRKTFGGIRILAPDGIDRFDLVALFGGDEDYLMKHWPVRDRDGLIVAFDAARLGEDLQAAVASKGQVPFLIDDGGAGKSILFCLQGR